MPQQLGIAQKITVPVQHAQLNMQCHAGGGSGDRSRKRAIEDELRDPSNFLE